MATIFLEPDELACQRRIKLVQSPFQKRLLQVRRFAHKDVVIPATVAPILPRQLL